MRTQDGSWLSEPLRLLCSAMGKAYSPDLAKAWEVGLDGCDQEAVKAAITEIIRQVPDSERRQPFPYPGQIRAMVQSDGKAPKWKALSGGEAAAAASHKDASRMHEAGIPFVLLSNATSDNPDPRDANGDPILHPAPFGEGHRRRYWAVCTRRDEWVDSRLAHGGIPPCVAAYTCEDVANCEPDVVFDCGRKIMALMFQERPVPGPPGAMHPLSDYMPKLDPESGV